MSVKDAELKKPEKDPKLLEHKIPEDSYHVVRILFFFMGLVYALPWGFFGTANRYWMYKFRNTSIENATSEDRTDLQAEFSAVFTIVLQISNIVFHYITLFWGYKIRVRIRLLGTMTGMTCLFLLTAIFVEIDTDSWQVEFFVLTMITIGATNCLNAMLDMTIYSVLCRFPPDYIGPYLVGRGLCSITSSSLQLMTLATGLGAQDTALMYFLLGTGIIAFTVLFIIFMEKNKFYVYHMSEYREGQKEEMITWDEIKVLFNKVWTSIVGMTLWNLTVDPPAGTNPLVVSEGEGNGPWNDIYFVPVITFFLGSICDMIGRQICLRWKINIPGIWVVIISGARFFIFVPLFLLCNAQPRHHLPVVFPHDYQYITLIVFYTLSNGYLTALYLINIPKLVLPHEQKYGFQLWSAVVAISGAVLSFISFLSVKIL